MLILIIITNLKRILTRTGATPQEVSSYISSIHNSIHTLASTVATKGTIHQHADGITRMVLS